MAVEAALTGDPDLVFHAVAYDPLSAAVLSLARDQEDGPGDAQEEQGLPAAVQETGNIRGATFASSGNTPLAQARCHVDYPHGGKQDYEGQQRQAIPGHRHEHHVNAGKVESQAVEDQEIPPTRS